MRKFKATAISPANIAFIKYWGKKDPKINLPFNNSISMNLSRCLTTTTVEFNKRFKKDRVFLNRKEVFGGEKERVVKILDLIRRKARINFKTKVVSQNNFPASAGIASSASGFAALTLAASRAAGLSLSKKELSIIARLGSGSASRSIPDGFAEWKKGKNSRTSFAIQIAPPEHWDLRDIVAVVAKEKKKASSTEGHALALTSPYFQTRLVDLRTRIKNLREALLKKQFQKFGKLLEEEAISLHMIAMTSRPPIFYWNEGTIEIIDALQEWREKGLFAFFTIDAGPNVHVICQGKDEKTVNRKLKKLKSVLFTIVNKPAGGVRSINRHLF